MWKNCGDDLPDRSDGRQALGGSVQETDDKGGSLLLGASEGEVPIIRVRDRPGIRGQKNMMYGRIVVD